MEGVHPQSHFISDLAQKSGCLHSWTNYSGRKGQCGRNQKQAPKLEQNRRGREKARDDTSSRQLIIPEHLLSAHSELHALPEAEILRKWAYSVITVIRVNI